MGKLLTWWRRLWATRPPAPGPAVGGPVRAMGSMAAWGYPLRPCARRDPPPINWYSRRLIAGCRPYRIVAPDPIWGLDMTVGLMAAICARPELGGVRNIRGWPSQYVRDPGPGDRPLPLEWHIPPN